MTEKRKFTPKLPPEQRKALILSAAVAIANDPDIGLMGVTFTNVADRCSVHTEARTVQHYFNIEDLRHAVAIDTRSDSDVKRLAVDLGIIPEIGTTA